MEVLNGGGKRKGKWNLADGVWCFCDATLRLKEERGIYVKLRMALCSCDPIPRVCWGISTQSAEAHAREERFCTHEGVWLW